jgi:hypothetical protein
VSEVCSVTGVDRTAAEDLLRGSDGDVDGAIDTYYARMENAFRPRVHGVSDDAQAVSRTELSGPIEALAFYGEYHGHRIRHLASLMAVMRPRGIVWLVGDSSLDNKYWFDDGMRDACNGYERKLRPPKSKADVCFWINTVLVQRGEGSRLCAVRLGWACGMLARLRTERMWWGSLQVWEHTGPMPVCHPSLIHPMPTSSNCLVSSMPPPPRAAEVPSFDARAAGEHRG